VKKKGVASSKDKKDWDDFINDISNIVPKAEDQFNKNIEKERVERLDLHGFSLTEANKKVEKFIINSFDNGVKKLLIITGRGKRSKTYDNPYLSEKLSVLKYSIPEYLKKDKNLYSMIKKITQADVKDGGEGAIYIFLKKKL
tara:strand:- start:3221 stop:3646 length:426 start_codon:yes stop_codon:yes gene_type:complete